MRNSENSREIISVLTNVNRVPKIYYVIDL